MSNPTIGDLLVQRLPGLPAEFVISDAITRRTLASGYSRFEDALAYALTHAAKMGVLVWHIHSSPDDPERLISIAPQEAGF